MTFTASRTVEQLILDTITRKRPASCLTVQEAPLARARDRDAEQEARGGSFND